MVVLSVALCTKSGKSLFARQYVDMTRGRVEGLLAAFPKLIGSASASSQHTYVETDVVRYVYHPLDKLYIVLITNKHSNIMEDLSMLQLLSKLIPDLCGSTAYDVVQANVFQVLFAFDEVITSGGYKEDITVRQVRQNMEMNSHDERLALLIRQSKINEANETAHAKAKALTEAKRAAARAGLSGGGGDSWGLKSAYGSSSAHGVSSPSRGRSSYSTPAPAPAAAAPAPAAPRTKRGMKLGSKKANRADQALADLMKEEHIPSSVTAAAAAAGAGVDESKAAGPAVDVEVDMAEKLSIDVGRDGAVRKMQTAGTLTLVCNSANATRLKLAVLLPDDSGFQFQPHPNVSKPAWKSKVLTLKDLSRTFPVGTNVSLLRWRGQSTSESSLPIALNVWPDSLEDGVVTVTVDYTLVRTDLTLSDVIVRIPLPPGATPKVNQCDGVQNHVTREDALEWSQTIVDASCKEGTLEFEVACDDESAFFPVQVTFTSQTCLCPLQVVSADGLDEEGNSTGACTFRQRQSLVVSKYQISD